jgi:chromosome segregation ATPase
MSIDTENMKIRTMSENESLVRNKLEQVMHELSSNTTNLSESKAESKRLENDNSLVSSREHAVNRNISNIDKDIGHAHDMINAHNDKISEVHRDMLEYKSKLSDLRKGEPDQAFGEKINTLIQHKDVLKSAISAATNLISDHVHERSNARVALDEIHKTSAKLGGALFTVKGKADTLISVFNKLTAVKDEITSHLDALHKDINTSRRIAQSHTNDILQTNKDVHDVTNEHNKAQGSMSRSNLEKDQNKDIISRITDELNSRNNHSSMFHSMINDVESDINSHGRNEDMLDKDKQRLDDIKNDHDKESRKHDEEMSKVRKILA